MAISVCDHSVEEGWLGLEVVMIHNRSPQNKHHLMGDIVDIVRVGALLLQQVCREGPGQDEEEYF